jgi:hypothetical protein
MNEMISDMDFESKLAKLGDNQTELLKFVARQQYESCQTLTSHDTRISTLETGSRKASGITGGITGTITGIIVGLISYFTSKGN